MTENRIHILTDSSGSWQVSLYPPDERPEGEPHGSEAIIMIDDQQTVLVRNVDGRLNTPGGHPEPGESSEETMIREVREEACAEVTSWTPIAFARSEKLDGDNAGFAMVRDMYVARVVLLPWEQPAFEIVERMVVDLDDLVEIMSADWPGLDDFSAELVELARDALQDI
ncbi:MAG: NUDIX domain-containing protein [Thermomicrobiales bacterium]|nr:NUDIX domain-containing protein [Thermomicrobiales bacterium]